MRIVLLLLAAMTVISCSEPASLVVAKQQVKRGNHDPKQYSLLNEQMVYNARFAEIFGLDPANAIELDPGVLAIRIYWTVFANRDFAYAFYEPHEYRDKLPTMQVQMFLADNVPIQFERQEATQYNYESFVRSGFLYFQHPPPKLPEPFKQDNYHEFYHRVILSNELDGAMSSTINRYKRTLVPGVTALEFDGGLYKTPFAIYMYIGAKPASPAIMAPQSKRVALSIDDYDPTLFFRVRVPDELTWVLNHPYREE